jgi:hypothetical protein
MSYLRYLCLRTVVFNTYCVAFFFVLFAFVMCLVYDGVKHTLCCVFSFFSCLRLVSCV